MVSEYRGVSQVAHLHQSRPILVSFSACKLEGNDFPSANGGKGFLSTSPTTRRQRPPDPIPRPPSCSIAAQLGGRGTEKRRHDGPASIFWGAVTLFFWDQLVLSCCSCSFFEPFVTLASLHRPLAPGLPASSVQLPSFSGSSRVCRTSKWIFLWSASMVCGERKWRCPHKNGTGDAGAMLHVVSRRPPPLSQMPPRNERSRYGATIPKLIFSPSRRGRSCSESRVREGKWE